VLIVIPLLPLGLYLGYLFVPATFTRLFTLVKKPLPFNLENNSTNWGDDNINGDSVSVASTINELHVSDKSPVPSIERCSALEMMNTSSFSASRI
jgi:hypothetical protein